MSDQNVINSVLSNLRSADTSTATKEKKKNGAIGQDEFLTMLVAQLKNQDPLNPMQNEEFAVNLAQFSQLERLISIDQKLGNEGADISSYAAYLGKEVTLNGDTVGVDNGDGGKLSYELVSRVNDLKVELKDATGNIVKTIDVGQVEGGRHQLSLNDLDIPNGDYTVAVTARSASGERFNVRASPVAVVTGFVPGDPPMLLIGDREISPSEITRVNTAS